MQHSRESRRIMPCQGLFLLPIASPHSALGRSLPWHSLGCRDPALKERTLPSRKFICIALHAETYPVKGCEGFSSFELSASSHPTLPLTSLCLAALPSVPAGSALSPAALCRGAAPGQSCLSTALPACHDLPPSQEPGPAQQQRTSPRWHFNDPSGGFGADSMNRRQ